MMWSWEKKEKDIDHTVNKIEAKVDELIAERDFLKARLDKFNKALTDEPFALDFEVVKVFSIERNIHNDEPCTIIGYLGENQNMLEWYWYCSTRRHKELVEAFENFKIVRDIRVYNKE
jgi:hypothetical protein